MAITVNRATLARRVNDEIEYIYPKTYSDLVEYDSTQNVKEKIDSIDINTENKVNKPVDENGNIIDGEPGQVLETNGDGTTKWVKYVKIYIGSGDMPEGYDIQIDPDSTNIEIDKTLSIEGAVAESSAVGAAIGLIKEKISSDIEIHNVNTTAHIDIRMMMTDVKDYILLRDSKTGEIHKLVMENGHLIIDSAIIKCTGINITTAPIKTSYNVGDLFDPSGMVVSASYDDGTTKEVNNYIYSTASLVTGDTSITIIYIEDGSLFTNNVPITVTE